MRLSPSLDSVGCWSSHEELTIGPRFTGADHGPNCWAKAAGQNTIESATKTAEYESGSRVRNLLVMCSSSFFFLLLARRLCGKPKKQAILGVSSVSPLHLPIYLSERIVTWSAGE